MTWEERESALLGKKRRALSASSSEETPRGVKSLGQKSNSVAGIKAVQTETNVLEPNVAGDGSSERTAEISSEGICSLNLRETQSSKAPLRGALPQDPRAGLS